MLQLKLRDHLTKDEIKVRMLAQKDVRIYTYWQILNAVINAHGKRAQEIADILGTSATIVKRIVRSYNNHGAEFDKPLRWGGRRDATSFMSVEEEEKMMKQLESKALKGAILTFKDIKETVEKKLGKEVSADYIWDLFKRNHWSKRSPRPKHPKQDVDAQERFKKNSLSYWLPASMK